MKLREKENIEEKDEKEVKLDGKSYMKFSQIDISVEGETPVDLNPQNCAHLSVNEHQKLIQQLIDSVREVGNIKTQKNLSFFLV